MYILYYCNDLLRERVWTNDVSMYVCMCVENPMTTKTFGAKHIHTHHRLCYLKCESIIFYNFLLINIYIYIHFCFILFWRHKSTNHKHRDGNI